MRNIYLTSLFKLERFCGYVQAKDPSIPQESFGMLEEIANMSRHSYCRFLEGEFESRVIRGTVPDYGHMFVEVFRETRRLWQEGDTNIFFADIDSLAVKPMHIFGEFPLMTMFGLSRDGMGPFMPGTVYYCGARYFPAAMSPDVWEAGAKILSNPKIRWSVEQYAYNRMLYQQFPSLAEKIYRRPREEEYCPPIDPRPELLGIPRFEEGILPCDSEFDPEFRARHYFTSKGVGPVLARMRIDYEKLVLGRTKE